MNCMPNPLVLPMFLAISLASGACTAGPAKPALTTSAVADMVQWIAQTGDNGAQPFAIIDKKAATLYVFDADRILQAASPVLLGAALGDQSVLGIGERAMKDIQPHERTTPAGRFATDPGMNLQGEKIVWVDYDAGISMHSVRATNQAERRLQRLQTADPGDNRISYGCINVPAAFFQHTVQPVFGRYRAVVYILPEQGGMRSPRRPSGM